MLDDGRGVVLFIHDAGIHADSWARWMELFDRSGYDGIALRWPGELPTVADTRATLARPLVIDLVDLVARVAAAARSMDRRPILVGHGVGGLVALGLLGRCELAAVMVLAPSRQRYPTGARRWAIPIGVRGRPPPAAPVEPGDPPLLVVSVGGIHSRSARTARRIKRGHRAASTDHVRVPGTEHSELVHGIRWQVTADLCLDWLTVQNQ